MSDELKALIEAARSVRRSLYEHKESEDCGEIYYADAMSDSIEGLVSALNNYQVTKACSEVSESVDLPSEAVDNYEESINE